jgi:hypothetical protein
MSLIEAAMSITFNTLPVRPNVIYLLPELQTIFAYEYDHFSTWIGPEVDFRLFFYEKRMMNHRTRTNEIRNTKQILKLLIVVAIIAFVAAAGLVKKSPGITSNK